MQEDRQHNQQRDPMTEWVALIQTQLQQMQALLPPSPMQPHLQRIQEASDALLALLRPPAMSSTLFAPESAATSQPALTQTASSDQEINAHRSLHILLVEDNPFTQKLMSRLLKLRAYQITIASHGEDALQRVQAAAVQGETFDIILMDIRMPGMDGFATTAALRQWEREQGRPRVPIIAVTVLNSDDDRQRALLAGMDGFHPKPVQANLLFTEMEQLIPAPLSASRDDVDTPPAFGQEIPAPSTAPIDVGLNMQLLLKTVENDWLLLKEIIDLYRMDAPKQLQRIQEGIQRQDPDLVREAAHSLKGASAAFGKSTLTYALAYQLEQAGHTQNLAQAKEIFHQLRHSIELLEQALAAELLKHSSH
ncbi:MAG: response regulator [Magnetococcales bacterium]|nr:response regulator [Magnetococcales bacterium]